MNIKSMIPSVPEIAREALIVLAGAVIATVIVRALPAKYKALFTFPNSNTTT